MSKTTNKYSLWIVPKDETANKLNSLVQTLATKNDAPEFIPHITLVGNIHAHELESVTEKMILLAERLSQFSISLVEHGYFDEEFRCLFLHAQSEDLDSAYEKATNLFPQVQEEHFKLMPHLSVLYGNFPEQKKLEIIDEYTFEHAEFIVDSLDLYKTNDPIKNWKYELTIPIPS